MSTQATDTGNYSQHILNRSNLSSYNTPQGSSSKQNSNNSTNGHMSNIEVSKSPPSKNLAHVPCKFFKQGACQAGSSCPFSHTLDSAVETAPCKYFQKGNCKFGLKCALAHILPDGRRVNPKSLAQVYQSQQQQQQQQQQQNSNGTGGQTLNGNSHHHLNGSSAGHGGSNSLTSGLNGGLNMSYYSTQTTSAAIPTPKMISPIQTIPTSSSSFNQYTSTGTISTNTSSFDSPVHNNSHPRAYSSTSPLKSNNATSPFTSSSIWSTDSRYRSLSHSNTVVGSRPLFAKTINESAIIDDDDDDDEDDGNNDEKLGDDVYEEDFVPSSLSDLLTPQELKRRGSRPGSNGLRPQLLQKSSGSGNGEEDIEMQFKLEEDWVHGA